MAVHRSDAARITAIAACGILIAAGCGSESPVAVTTLPINRIALSPPESYLQWWGQMEQCSGLTGSFAAVKWYQVPGVASFTSNGVAVFGTWELESNSITLAAASLDDFQLVRHEELHALLQSHGHPPEYFVTKCGPLLGPYTN